MRQISVGMLAIALILLAAVVLVTVGPPRHAPHPVAEAIPEPPVAVEADGVRLASASIDLPDEESTYPDGPHVAAVNAHCASCHSASMVLAQPPLKPDQWTAIVEKMREAYKAPVPDAAVPEILAYLTDLSAHAH